MKCKGKSEQSIGVEQSVNNVDTYLDPEDENRICRAFFPNSKQKKKGERNQNLVFAIKNWKNIYKNIGNQFWNSKIGAQISTVELYYKDQRG